MKPGLACLLVEDEALIAMDLSWQFTKAGFDRCRVAATGETALACLENDRFDVVVLDNHLAGGMDGIETAARIRAISDIPIVFMTGYPQDEALLKKIRPFTPAPCVDKPVVFSELLAAIDLLVSRRQRPIK